MTRRRQTATALVFAAAVLASGCSKDTGDVGRDAGAAVHRTTTTVAPRTVERCGGLSAEDIDRLGVAGLEVVTIQEVSDVLQGSARGGHGCWFDLKRTRGEKTARTSLTVLVHPTGQPYFDAAQAEVRTTTPIPGLGDQGFAAGPTDESPALTVITRRGPLVVEAEVGDGEVLGRDQLIAIAGLALERA